MPSRVASAGRRSHAWAVRASSIASCPTRTGLTVVPRSNDAVAARRPVVGGRRARSQQAGPRASSSASRVCTRRFPRSQSRSRRASVWPEWWCTALTDRRSLMARRVHGVKATGVECTLLRLGALLDNEAFEIAFEDARRRRLTSFRHCTRTSSASAGADAQARRRCARSSTSSIRCMRRDRPWR